MMGKISVTCPTGLPRTHLPAPHALLRGCGVASRPACPPAGDRDDVTVLVRAFFPGTDRQDGVRGSGSGGSGENRLNALASCGQTRLAGGAGPRACPRPLG